MRGRSDDDGYRNQEACITMHQPWASLLVHGIKRIEGRSWPAPLRGRLWIHAASKVPDSATIKAMEDFYREIYAVDGITDLTFPDHYPVSRLLGCVEVVGCVKCEELVSWEAVPEGVRLEGMTNFCWLCEKPQKLLVPFGMRGNQGVYNLERQIYEATVGGLCRIECPLPVKFPLPDPRKPFSFKPGSLMPCSTSSKTSKVEKPPSLTAAIVGARAAASQYSKKEVKHHPNSVQERRALDSSSRQYLGDKFTEEDRKSTATLQQRPQERDSVHNFKEQNIYVNPPSLTAATTGVRVAATQYSKKEVKHHPNSFQERRAFDSSSRQYLDDKFTEEDIKSTATLQQRPQRRDSVYNFKEQNTCVVPPSLTAATTGARAAATQYSKKEVKHHPNSVHERRAFDSSSRQYLDNKFTEEDRKSTATLQQRPQERDSVHKSTYVNPPSLTAATAGARVAATQYSKKEVIHKKNTVQETETFDSSSRQHSKNRFTEDRKSTATVQDRPQEKDSVNSYEEQNSHVKCERSSSGDQDPRQDLNNRLGAPSKIFAAALKGLRPS